MIPVHDAAPAPELQVSEWLNAPAPVKLASLIGRVVVIQAFQMLSSRCWGYIPYSSITKR